MRTSLASSCFPGDRAAARRSSPSLLAPASEGGVNFALSGGIYAPTHPTPRSQLGRPLAVGCDLGHTRYSALDQIDADNFSDLEVAWRFKTESLGPRPEFIFQSTPLMVGGVLYTTAGTRRAAVAIDAETGEMLWVHRLNEGERGAGAPRRLSGRGLTYWDDGADGVIFYVTPGYRLIALNALTGIGHHLLDQAFGHAGGHG